LGLSFKSYGFKKDFNDNISIKDLVEMRNKARVQRDFKKADEIRKELEDQGIILEDTKDGTIWRQA